MSDTDRYLSYILFEMHDNGGSISFSHQFSYWFTVLVYRELSWKYPYIFFSEVQAYFALHSVSHNYLEQSIPFSTLHLRSLVIFFLSCFAFLDKNPALSDLPCGFIFSFQYFVCQPLCMGTPLVEYA